MTDSRESNSNTEVPERKYDARPQDLFDALGDDYDPTRVKVFQSGVCEGLIDVEVDGHRVSWTLTEKGEVHIMVSEIKERLKKPCK